MTPPSNLEGTEEQPAASSPPPSPTLRIVLLGPPGCGKGTQSAHIKEHFSLAHLATGDMLRAAVARGTPTGKRAKEFMDQGLLVPDEIVLDVVADAVKDAQCRHGFIFDGFPRTITQAEQLDLIMQREKMHLHAVLEFDIADSLLVRRITGRLIHPPSGRTYHEEFHPPRVPMTDDVTGEPLMRRSDDNEEALRQRLVAYHEQTKPLAAYYEHQGILHRVDAAKMPREVWGQIATILDQHEGRKA